MPEVSVIIPTRNRAGPVRDAVASVLAQTFTDFELIVVDDGGTDDTREALIEFGRRVTYIFREHGGVSAARNTGLGRTRGELIAFLDSDDAWLPAKLAVQVDFFKENPEGLICQTEETWYRRGRRVNPRFKHRKPSGDIFLPSLELCLVSPSAVMMRRTLFDEVGLFDEDLPACEDYDLWLRVAARHPVHLLPQALVIKTGGHPDQLSRTTPALDQYRVRALQKIIESGLLSPERERAARAVLGKKARLYGQGCVKRGRVEEGSEYLELARRFDPDGEGPA